MFLTNLIRFQKFLLAMLIYICFLVNLGSFTVCQSNSILSSVMLKFNTIGLLDWFVESHWFNPLLCGREMVKWDEPGKLCCSFAFALSPWEHGNTRSITYSWSGIDESWQIGVFNSCGYKHPFKTKAFF